MDHFEAHADSVVPVARQHVPTLVLGLGGIGSQIVQRVYERLPQRERGRVVMHVIDTNVNDLLKIDVFRTPETRTQIGTHETVGQLRRMHRDVDAWFKLSDAVHGTLDRRRTIDGASQVRLISRLALMHGLRSGRFSGLDRAITKLYQLWSDQGSSGAGLRYEPRVMIVSSLAGGTGAGAFISAALLVRSMLAQHAMEPDAATIRGAFVLPDVLIRNGLLPDRESASTRANAQASLMELEAILEAVQGRGEAVELEQGIDGTLRAVEVPPYAYCFLFDYENMQAQVLGSFEDYLEQVSRCVHHALFSPLGSQQYSQEDNTFRGAVDKDDRARYASAATSSLNYPVDDLVAYLAARWGQREIDEYWLAPDVDFKKRMAEYRNALRRGVLEPEPVLSTHFRGYLAARASEEGASAAFFKDVYQDAHLAVGDRPLGKSRARAWYDSMVSFLDRAALGGMPDDLGVDGLALRSPERVRSAVEEAERRLHAQLQRVERFIPEHVYALTSQIMTRDAEEDVIFQGTSKHRMNYWMFEGDRAVHPLAARYVLYEVEEQLEKLVAQLAERNTTLHEAIHAYRSQAFDQPDTARQETVYDRIDEVLHRGPLARLLNRNALNEFASYYETESGAQFAAIREYAASKLREDVFRRVLGEVASFLQEWERFFDALERVQDRMAGRALDLQARHDRTRSKDPTTVYVLADSDAKQRLWQEMIDSLASVDATPVHRVAYEQVYRYYCTRHEGSNAPLAATFATALDGVLQRAVRAADMLPTTLVDALRKEAAFAGIPSETQAVDSYLRQRVSELPQLAHPYVTWKASSTEPTTRLSFWGTHPDTFAQLPAAVLDVMPTAQAKDADPAFHPNEILYYTTVYLIRARELAKFTPSPRSEAGVTLGVPAGTYYTAYGAVMKKVLENGITPHLANDWHIRLHTFWDATPTTNRVMLEALALGIVRLEAGTRGTPPKWTFVNRQPSGASQPEALADGGGAGQLRGLQSAVDGSEHLRRIRAVVEKSLVDQRQSDLQRYGDRLQYHGLVKGVRSVPNTEYDLFTLVVDAYNGEPQRDADQRLGDTQRLLRGLCELVRRYVSSVIGDEVEARRRTRSIVRTAFDRVAPSVVPKPVRSALEYIVREY